MNRYQRCLSRSLIFFTSIMIVFLLTIETNSGFQWIFRITNYFFLGLKTEKISGNWRDFTLHNIDFHLINLSITASSIRCVINIQSFLNFFHIIQEIDTKHLIITVHDNKSMMLQKIKKFSYIQNHIFFVRHFIIEKIKIDELLLKMDSEDIRFFHISSGIKIDTNHITVLPTHISHINILLKTYNVFTSKKKIIESTSFKIIDKQHIFNFSPELIKKYFSVKIDINRFICNHLQYFYNEKILNFTKIALKANIKNNIIHIKKIQANINSLIINSKGIVILNKNSSLSYAIQNKLFITNINNKPLIMSITGTLDSQYSCNIEVNDLFQMHIQGIILLNNFNHSFYIQCDSSNVQIPIHKKTLLNIDILHFVLKGNLNYCSFAVNNVFHINRILSIYSDIRGHADIQNIFIEKINIFQIKKNIFYEKLPVMPIIPLKKNPLFPIDHDRYKSIWSGHVNILGDKNSNSYNFFMPNIDIHGSFMEKKISVLGSLYYKHFNFCETSGINFFLGKNKIFLKGSLGRQYNFDSVFNIHHLDYFLPHFQGIITGKSHLSGMFFSPILNAEVLGKNLQWNNIYLKKIKFMANINQCNSSVNYILTYIKNFSCSLFNIDSLYIKSEFKKNKTQNFCFVLKNKNIYINIIFHSIFDPKTGQWHGTFKKIHLDTVLGDLLFLNSPVLHYIMNINSDRNGIAPIKNIFSSIFSSFNHKILQICDAKLLNIQYQFSFNAELKWTLGRFLYDGHILLVSKNILLENNIKQKNVINKIKSLELHSRFQNNIITVNWFLECLNNKLQLSLLSGVIHIKKINNMQTIDGYCHIFRFPCAMIKFFVINCPDIQKGTMIGKLTFSGDIWHPRVFSDIHLYGVVINSNNLFKYISFCFHSFFKNIKYITINQIFCIKTGHIFFILDSYVNNLHTAWNLFFESYDATISFFSHISFQFFPHIELNYVSSQYDLMGIIKFLLSCFQINEKNIIF